ncbi:MAG: MEDS domain-containing protein, partial [bacterium]
MKQGRSNNGSFLEAIAGITTHDYACLICKTRDEMADAVAPFVACGLAAGDACLVASDKRAITSIQKALPASQFNAVRKKKQCDLVTVTKRSELFGSEKFNPRQGIKFLAKAHSA